MRPHTNEAPQHTLLKQILPLLFSLLSASTHLMSRGINSSLLLLLGAATDTKSVEEILLRVLLPEPLLLLLNSLTRFAGILSVALLAFFVFLGFGTPQLVTGLLNVFFGKFVEKTCFRVGVFDLTSNASRD